MSVTQVSKVDRESMWDALDDVSSVLILGDESHESDEICPSLLSVTSPEQTHYLSVSFDGTPDDRLDSWRADIGDLPAEVGIIAVGETTRSAAAASAPGPGPSTVTIDTVSNPSDLTGLAMAISAYLDAWSEADATPVVCFDSITSLLFHADQERTFRFLHATTGRLRDLGAVAHYHLAESPYEESTINMFSALFDAVVRIGDDSVSVYKRR